MLKNIHSFGRSWLQRIEFFHLFNRISQHILMVSDKLEKNKEPIKLPSGNSSVSPIPTKGVEIGRSLRAEVALGHK